MVADEIVDTVVNWIAETAAKRGFPFDVGPATRILEEDILSSMDLLNLVMFLETRFGVRIDPTALVPENFTDPAAIARIVEGSQQGR